ncbi:hypothetical protein J6590_026470 [Homalodisca vitripennis]|nr:hypothetical protein J6590_026470 [Homalodisca vitripennis]
MAKFSTSSDDVMTIRSFLSSSSVLSFRERNNDRQSNTVTQSCSVGDLFFDKRVPKRGGGGSTPRLPQAVMVTDLPSFNEHLTPPPSLYRGRLDVLRYNCS